MPWLPPVPCVPSSQLQRKMTVSGTPTVYVFSPVASKNYVGFEEGAVTAYSVESGNELCQFGQSKSRVESLAASPDGKYIVASDGGGAVRAWNIESGQELPIYHNQRNVRGVAFDTSNHLLRLFGSSPSHVVVDMASREMISSTDFREVMAGPRYNRSNGRLFAFGSGHQLCLKSVPERSNSAWTIAPKSVCHQSESITLDWFAASDEKRRSNFPAYANLRLPCSRPLLSKRSGRRRASLFASRKGTERRWR